MKVLQPLQLSLITSAVQRGLSFDIASIRGVSKGHGGLFLMSLNFGQGTLSNTPSTG